MITFRMSIFTGHVSRLSKNSAVKRWAYIFAAIAFAAGLYASYSAMPEIVSKMRWKFFLLVVLVGVPITQMSSAVEMMLMSRLVGKKFSLSESFRIAIVGGAANMLPIPGGAIVRVAALKSRGAGVSEGIRVTIAVGILWIGVAFIYSGAWMILFNALLALTMIAAGSLSLAIGIWLGLKQYKRHMVIVKIIALKLFGTVLDSARLMLCLWALGEMVGFSVAGVLAASSVTGSAVSIVPAGLGIREGMSALLAGFTGLSMATGFLAAAINRIAELLILLPAALTLSFMGDKKKNWPTMENITQKL